MEPSKLLIWLQLAAIAGGGFYLMGQLQSDFEASKRYNTRQFELYKSNLSKQSAVMKQNQQDNRADMGRFNESLKNVEMDLRLIKKDVEHMDNVFQSAL